MPKEIGNISLDIFDFLKSRFELGESVDENGVATTDPNEMRVFSFDFKDKKGKEIGCCIISIMDDQESNNSLKIYFGNELQECDSASQKEWVKFIQEIRQFAKMHMLGFDVRNINKSTITKRDIDPIFESTFGPIDGTVRTSKQALDNMQIIIKHTANVDPKKKNARSRKIQKIYLTNSSGERFLLPFKSLSAARAMARHIQSGGTPYDAIGSDICSLVDEMSSLSKFVRRMKNNTFENPEAINAINSSTERVHEIKRKLSSLSSQGGYEKNKPLFTGEESQLDEEEDDLDLFGNDSLDEENKLALPFVNRAYRSRQIPRESGEFEQWANSVSTGEPPVGDEILNDEESKCGICGEPMENNGIDDSGLCRLCYNDYRNEEESNRYWEYNSSLDESLKESWEDELSKWVKSEFANPKLEKIVKERLPEMYARLDDLRHGRATGKMCKEEKARIAKALKVMSSLTEGDAPSSAGNGSPLTRPNLKPFNDFRSSKEINGKKNTSGKSSPLSLISGEDKELNEIIRLSRGNNEII